jgi:hypothetical protein
MLWIPTSVDRCHGPAVIRERMVNRIRGEIHDQLHERHPELAYSTSIGSNLMSHPGNVG